MKTLRLCDVLPAFKVTSAETYGDGRTFPPAQRTRLLALRDQPAMVRFLLGWSLLSPTDEFLPDVALDGDQAAELTEDRLWETLWYPFLRDPFALRDAIGRVVGAMGRIADETAEVPARRAALLQFERARQARYIYPDRTVDDSVPRLVQQIASLNTGATHDAGREEMRKLREEVAALRKAIKPGEATK